MSGGIDSTVCAYKLKQEGHTIEGVYMKLHDDEEAHKENIKKVAKVADYLKIKYHVLDLKERFCEFVYDPFVRDYVLGLTPNPCVLCNRYIKLGALIEYAKELGMDKLATGHYAQIKDGMIEEAVDKSKDQSYFLANVKKENLLRVIFPLGGMYKEDIKEFASKIDILKEFATQKESSEICFVPQTYIEILQKHINVDMPGKVVNTSGEVVGEHKGYMHYTIGKRRGFSVKGALDPHYVVDINPTKNEIVVGSKEALNVKTFEVKNLNMFKDGDVFECSVKIRYRSSKCACRVNIDTDKATVTLFDSVQGLAPGQAAVFYDGNTVIGCGWIV